jgi:DNA-binding transcriptional LysR family regulator
LDLSVSRSAPDDGELTSTLLWRDPLVCALPLGHALAGRKSIQLAELKHEDFVFLRLESSAFAQSVYDACVQAGFAPRIVQQVVEIPAVLNLVAAGLGVSLVPASLVRLREGAVVLCKLKGGIKASGVSGDVYLLRRTADSSPVVLEFAEALRDWACSQSA